MLAVMRPGPFENAVWYLNIAAALVLLARMHFQQLTGIYRLLVAYIVVDLIGDLAMLSATLAGSDEWVAFTYYGGQGIKVVLAAFVAMELFRLALIEHPALGRFGQKVIGYFFGFGVVLGALNVWFGTRYQGSEITGVFTGFERSMDLAVMVAMLLMIAFLLWYPVRMRRNVALCIGGFVLYSFQRWALLLSEALSPPLLRMLSTIMLCLSFGLFVFWTVTLRRSGEEITTVTGHRWNPASAAHLSDKLDQINARMKTIDQSKSSTIID